MAEVLKPKSIIQASPAVLGTPTPINPKANWKPEWFNGLVWDQGYDSYLDRALRCPCVDKATGQSLTTCRNCNGRGWLFVDRKETRIIAQHMDNKKRFKDWSEVNLGIASLTVRAVDRIGFMDRIVLRDLEGWFAEVIRPVDYGDEFRAYPVYEPLQVTHILMFIGDSVPLLHLTEDDWSLKDNYVLFSDEVKNLVQSRDMNTQTPDVSVSIRYSYHPVYHVLDMNRELMRVRPIGSCGKFTDDELAEMPINVMARKAHYLFGAQNFGDELIDNTL